MNAKYAAHLSGVPETMLCALHNRAAEAQRPDTYLKDPDCVRVYQSIDYNFDRSFGRPRGAHPMRSRLFDLTLRPWLARHPGGTVVELGAGLETQFQRCDDGKVRWVCIDLPEAIALRERVLPATERCRYLSQNAFDLSWMDTIDEMRGVFITGQGLLMYFTPAQVAQLFAATAARFSELEWMFDTIPRWLSKLTFKEFRRTAAYTAPPMPWGVNYDELDALLRSWSPNVTHVHAETYGFPRSLLGVAFGFLANQPVVRNSALTVVHVRCKEATQRSPMSSRKGPR